MQHNATVMAKISLDHPENQYYPLVLFRERESEREKEREREIDGIYILKNGLRFKNPIKLDCNNQYNPFTIV